MSTSSSPTCLTTQRQHSEHQEHLQAPSMDKLRHQASLWRENVRSGGNPRTTSPTGKKPKELATVSKIMIILEIYINCMKQEKFGEEDHRAPITEEVKEFAEIGTHSLPDSKISETSCFRSQMHFDDSVESIADSDLEDGELQKMLTFPYSSLLSPKSSCRHMFHRNLLGLFDHPFCFAYCTGYGIRHNLRQSSVWFIVWPNG